jgi:hypothetical protein
VSRDTGIADRLRAAGLRVVEVDGWQSRGSSEFNPRGSVNHHTAGPASGNLPSLDTLIYGRSDLPGPLCNVAQARNNDLYVIAAGRANHAGEGGWHGLSGNSSVYGLEVENVGTQAEPWRPDQVDVMARCHAALLRGPGVDSSTSCQHREWAPNRKPDAHDIDGNMLRGKIAHYLADGHQPPPTQGADRVMFCLISPEHAPGAPGQPAGVYRFDGRALYGVPNPTILGGDQIMLAALGLPNEVFHVSQVYFESWPIERG